MDEPIAEAVCIIADMDKWTVQVASSQRRMTDNKLGKEVLVSSLVSNLLHSTLQLNKHNLSPNFVSMCKVVQTPQSPGAGPGHCHRFVAQDTETQRERDSTKVTGEGASPSPRGA